MAETVLLSVEEHVAHITLNNPASHNALGREEIATLSAMLQRLGEDEAVRVVLLDAVGEQTFCAGASLKQIRAGELDGELFNTLTDRLAALPIPSVCAIGGNVFGGGAELALCCDYRIGVPGIRMLVPAARIGLCYPVGGLRRYVKKLGLSAAKRILLAAEELGTESMLAIGFLHRVVERDRLAGESAGFARHLASLAPLAVRAMKELLSDIAAGTLDEDRATALIGACERSDDLREGLQAQREKRAPCFSGK